MLVTSIPCRGCNIFMYPLFCQNIGLLLYLIAPFLVRFGSISGEFGRAVVRILARRSRAKIPKARPNEPDMLPKRTKKGAIKNLPYPNSS